MRPSKNVSYRVEQQNKKCIQIMILIAKDPRQDGLKKKKAAPLLSSIQESCGPTKFKCVDFT